jgi:putative ABC transport system permease protein
MEIPLLQGRTFDTHDVLKAPHVVIINETLARRYFPDADPIGKRITLNDETNPKEEDWETIIGVVKDTKPRALDGDPVAEMYMPFAQAPQRSMALMIRTTNKPEGMIASVRREVQTLDPNLPVYNVRTMGGVISESIAAQRFRTSLLGVFAVIALILALIGIYGVMSYAVTQRTHEIGIRMALGAQTSDVLKLVVSNGLALALTGVLVGLAASFALTRVMSQLLFGVQPTDPLTFMVIALLLTGVSLLACYIPARRAAKTDPMIALRYE